MAEMIEMRFPAKREYIKAIRLAVSGIACNIEYTVDEIEDLKTCVAEACILLLCGQTCEAIGLDIECSDNINFRIHGLAIDPVCEECDDCTGFNEEISRLMIQSLSEDVQFVEKDGVLNEILFKKSPTAQ
ncbi:MAG: hypothetical protein VB081_13930 [Christensenella sp.]|uniref:hypothetical protein n=1 Tax=Christensenella sp. TaxID=1935934 RepID=UPI002B1F28A0|nr:hypothetical protein [Christensenella sp.]MEA5004581.1 hypothetical protein [Christensenella sp.]